MRPLIALCALLIAGLTGCGDTQEEAPGNDTEVTYEPVFCDAPLPADPYRDGIEKMTESGAYLVRIVASEPAPPSKGFNALNLQVLSMDGTTIDDAAVTVSPYMPHHRHGTAPADYLGESQGSEGLHSIPEFYLFMPGYWEYRTHIAFGDGGEDTAVFAFCVDG